MGIYFETLEAQPNHVRWVTRGHGQRYRAVADCCGGYRWELVCGIQEKVLFRSTGCFYNDMEPCEPTFRKHHPSALVELVQGIRKFAHTYRSVKADLFKVGQT
jgi:hypothetical protein